MKKKIFSLLAVLLVAATAFATFVIVKSNGTITRVRTEQLKFEQKGTSFTLNGIDVKDIAYIDNKDWRSSGDYERAFVMKYIDSKYYAYDRKKQITSQEFKALLKTLVEKYNPDSMGYFNSRITDYDTPITRDIAAGMAYYIARCIGADTNNSPNNRTTIDNFWVGAWNNDQLLTKVLPFTHSKMIFEGGESEELIVALMWNGRHVSPVSSKEIIAFNAETGSFEWDKALTWEDAIRAITRLHDSFETEETNKKVALDDKLAVTPDPEIVTEDIINIAAQSKVTKLSELRKLSGIPLSERMTGSNKPAMTNWTSHAENAARWGFNSICYLFPTCTLMNWDEMTVNVSCLQMLDRLVAACIENNITLRIQADVLPGAGQYFVDDNPYADYIEDFTFDLTECEKGCRMWKMLSERYKDIPSEYLIFSPVHGKYDADRHEASVESVAKYMCKLIDQIREVNPNRFIYYSYTGINSAETITNDKAKKYYDTIEEKYDNVRILRNFAEVPYVFNTLTPGINMDLATHSTFLFEYPLTVYGACPDFSNTNPLLIDGCLPAGTKIDLFVKNTEGYTEGESLQIIADDVIIYEEAIPYGTKNYQTGYRGTEMFSAFFPYAESEKKISVTLEKDTKILTLATSFGSHVAWSGLDVYLPESYQVERWYTATQYDREKGYEKGWYWGPKMTSRVMISPQGDAHLLTIHDDVTFTSGSIVYQCNKESVNTWGDAIRKFSPQCGVEVEGQAYGGCTQAAMLRYCDDVYGMLHENGFDFWMTDYSHLFDEWDTEYQIGWRKVEYVDGYANFNVELLRTLQKYQYK